MITRRDLLRLAGAAGAVTIAPSAEAGIDLLSSQARVGEPATFRRVREPLQALTASEADLLDAVVARLIPTDSSGPGATEAHAVRYIDRALASALVSSRESYRVGSPRSTGMRDRPAGPHSPS